MSDTKELEGHHQESCWNDTIKKKRDAWYLEYIGMEMSWNEKQQTTATHRSSPIYEYLYLSNISTIACFLDAQLLSEKF